MWQQSRVFCTEIYAVTSSFPDSERFGLTSQLRRASVSIPSNIAAGSSRNSNKDLSRFLEIATGSAYEVETQLLIASDIKFITTEKLESLTSKLENIIKMISKFRSTIK
jgi:four helix bundle protein